MMLLLSVLLMPLGMTPLAGAVHGGEAMAAMPMGHCDRQSSKNDMKGGLAECTMACSSALPAFEPRRDGPVPIACSPLRPIAARALHGLHPETATPPPRPS